MFGKPYSKRKKRKYWKQKLKLKIETQKNTFVCICVYVWIDMYMFMVEQYKNNSSSWRSNPGLVKSARCNESAGRSHLGNWKLPTPPCIFLSFYRMKHCVPGKECSSLLLGTRSSLSSFSTSFAIPLLSTWTLLARCLWCGTDLGKDREAKLQVNSGAAENDFLSKWKPRTVRPLMCYNSFDYPHFWLSVNNVLNG